MLSTRRMQVMGTKLEPCAEKADLLLQGLLDVRQAALQHSQVLLYPHLLCFLLLYSLGYLKALALQVVHACR